MVAGLLIVLTGFCDLHGARAAAPRASAEGSGLFEQLSAARARLADHGITFGGFLQGDGSHVFSGGLPHALGFDAQSLIDLSVTIDTGKLLGWQGGTLFLDAQSHSGPSVVPNQVPALADPDNMDAGPTTSLDRVWFEQALFAHTLKLRLGLMYVDDQFYTVPFGENFVSLDFSSDASISTFVLPTYPKGAWGGDVFYAPNHSLSFSLGIFHDRETELPYNPGGALIVSEEAVRGHWHGLPLKLQLGAWIDTGRFRRFVGGVVHHAAGAYLVASSKLWQPSPRSARGIGVFLQYGAAPPSVAAVQTHFGAGLVWTGPTAARPHDEFGIAFSDSLLSPLARFRHSFESEIETYYQFDASHGLTIQPDLEYWQHPGGGSTPPTLLGLIRVMLNF
jgi:porin